jgi:cation transporter-like permease
MRWLSRNREAVIVWVASFIVALVVVVVAHAVAAALGVRLRPGAIALALVTFYVLRWAVRRSAASLAARRHRVDVRRVEAAKAADDARRVS